MMRILLLFILLMTTGCTSFMKTMNDDSVRIKTITEEIGKEGKQNAVATISLDATRRNVMVLLTNDGSFGKFCAEPQRSAELVATVAQQAARKAGKLPCLFPLRRTSG